MTSPKSEIVSLVSQIRDMVTDDRVRQELQKSPERWCQICASLDVLDDTQNAITTHFLKSPSPIGQGQIYLSIYGVMQAFFLQQDAAKHLAEALGVAVMFDAGLREIRKDRNASVGHPTKQEHGVSITSFHQIVQRSMGRSGFEIFSFDATGQWTSRWINLAQHQETQHQGVGSVLNTIIKNLRDNQEAHYAAFRSQSLAGLFAVSQYHVSKVMEGIYSKDDGIRAFAAVSVEQLANVIENLYAKASERSPALMKDFAEYHLPPIQHAIKSLKVFFSSSGTASLDDVLNARITAGFLETEIERHEQFAVEIDREYGSKDDALADSD